MKLRELLSPEALEALGRIGDGSLREAVAAVAGYRPFRRGVLRGAPSPARFALARRALRKAGVRIPRGMLARAVRMAEKQVAQAD